MDEGYLPYGTSFGAPPVHATIPAKGSPEESWVGGAFREKDYRNFPGKYSKGSPSTFLFNFDHTLHVGCPPVSNGVTNLYYVVTISLSLLHVSTKKTSLIEGIIDRRMSSLGKFDFILKMLRSQESEWLHPYLFMILMMGFNCGELMLFYIIAYIFILKSSSIINKFNDSAGFVFAY